MTTASGRNQAADAQYLYDARGPTYDDSWHPRFAQHVVELANVQPGERVLDLACGTGLVSFAARQAVGPEGAVVGVDISSGMMEQARRKLSESGVNNVTFYQHSITDLNTLKAIEGQLFDVVTCASALVLLKDAGAAVRQWTQFLRPGGRLIVDVTHPQSQIVGITFERVGRRLDRPVAYYRLAFQTPDDLKLVLRNAGLQDIEIKAVSQRKTRGTERLQDYLVADTSRPPIEFEYAADEADALFDGNTHWRAHECLAHPAEIRAQAKSAFREEWAKSADRDGKVRDVDIVWVGTGWKA